MPETLNPHDRKAAQLESSKSLSEFSTLLESLQKIGSPVDGSETQRLLQSVKEAALKSARFLSFFEPQSPEFTRERKRILDAFVGVSTSTIGFEQVGDLEITLKPDFEVPIKHAHLAEISELLLDFFIYIQRKPISLDQAQRSFLKLVQHPFVAMVNNFRESLLATVADDKSVVELLAAKQASAEGVNPIFKADELAFLKEEKKIGILEPETLPELAAQLNLPLEVTRDSIKVGKVIQFTSFDELPLLESLSREISHDLSGTFSRERKREIGQFIYDLLEKNRVLSDGLEKDVVLETWTESIDDLSISVDDENFVLSQLLDRVETTPVITNSQKKALDIFLRQIEVITDEFSHTEGIFIYEEPLNHAKVSKSKREYLSQLKRKIEMAGEKTTNPELVTPLEEASGSGDPIEVSVDPDIMELRQKSLNSLIHDYVTNEIDPTKKSAWVLVLRSKLAKLGYPEIKSFVEKLTGPVEFALFNSHSINMGRLTAKRGESLIAKLKNDPAIRAYDAFRSHEMYGAYVEPISDLAYYIMLGFPFELSGDSLKNHTQIKSLLKEMLNTDSDEDVDKAIKYIISYVKAVKPGSGSRKVRFEDPLLTGSGDSHEFVVEQWQASGDWANGEELIKFCAEIVFRTAPKARQILHETLEKAEDAGLLPRTMTDLLVKIANYDTALRSRRRQAAGILLGMYRKAFKFEDDSELTAEAFAANVSYQVGKNNLFANAASLVWMTLPEQFRRGVETRFKNRRSAGTDYIGMILFNRDLSDILDRINWEYKLGKDKYGFPVISPIPISLDDFLTNADSKGVRSSGSTFEQLDNTSKALEKLADMVNTAWSKNNEDFLDTLSEMEFKNEISAMIKSIGTPAAIAYSYSSALSKEAMVQVSNWVRSAVEYYILYIFSQVKVDFEAVNTAKYDRRLKIAADLILDYLYASDSSFKGLQYYYEDPSDPTEPIKNVSLLAELTSFLSGEITQEYLPKGPAADTKGANTSRPPTEQVAQVFRKQTVGGLVNAGKEQLLGYWGRRQTIIEEYNLKRQDESRDELNPSLTDPEAAPSKTKRTFLDRFKRALKELYEGVTETEVSEVMRKPSWPFGGEQKKSAKEKEN